MSGSSSSTTSSSSVFSPDSFDPLYIHPSDHPGMILVSKQFDGSGFSSWKKAMSIALSAKNKLGFVNGTIVKPASTSPEFNHWQRCNDTVTSWILNTLTKDISDSVLYSDSVHQIWNELEERFGQSNGAKLYQLQKDMSLISQGNCDIASYFTKFKKNWDELSLVSLLPTCSCGAAQALLKHEQDQRLMQFVMGLNSDYNTIRGNLLMMNPLPSISQAYALLIQEERQREIHASTNFITNSASMNVASRMQDNFRGRYESKKHLICTHCKRSGHIVDKCYKLIGFPKDFKFTKGKRFAATCINDNAGGEEECGNVVGQNLNIGGLTQEVYNQLIRLLSNTQFSDKSTVNSELNKTSSSTQQLTSNFAGPFHEEASGVW